MSSQSIFILISICNFVITENHFAKLLKEKCKDWIKIQSKTLHFALVSWQWLYSLIPSILVSRNIKRVLMDLVFHGGERCLRNCLQVLYIPCRKCSLQYNVTKISHWAFERERFYFYRTDKRKKNRTKMKLKCLLQFPPAFYK